MLSPTGSIECGAQLRDIKRRMAQLNIFIKGDIHLIVVLSEKKTGNDLRQCPKTQLDMILIEFT